MVCSRQEVVCKVRCRAPAVRGHGGGKVGEEVGVRAVQAARGVSGVWVCGVPGSGSGARAVQRCRRHVQP